MKKIVFIWLGIFLIGLEGISFEKEIFCTFKDMLKQECCFSISQVKLISVPSENKTGGYWLTDEELNSFIESFSFQKIKKNAKKYSEFHVLVIDQSGEKCRLFFGESKKGEMLAKYYGDYYPLSKKAEEMIRNIRSRDSTAYYYELDISRGVPPDYFKENFEKINTLTTSKVERIDYEYWVKVNHYFKTSFFKETKKLYRLSKEEENIAEEQIEDLFLHCEILEEWMKEGLIFGYEIREFMLGFIMFKTTLRKLPYNSFKICYLFLDPTQWPQLEKRLKDRNDIYVVENNLDRKTYQIILEVPKENIKNLCPELLDFSEVKSCEQKTLKVGVDIEGS